MPKDHLLIIGVISIRIKGFSGPFTNRPERLLPKPVKFPHRLRSVLRPEQVGPVVPHFEQHLVREFPDFGPDHIGRNRVGQGFLDRGIRLDRSGNALRFQRITAVPEVFPEGRDVEPGDLVGRNGLADPDLHRRSPLVEDFVDKPDGAQARMDPAQPMEHPGIAPVEIDGDDRKTGLLHQLDDILGPGDVLDDLSRSGRCPVLPLLPGGHFPRREKTQRFPIRNVAEGRPDTGDAARPAGREIVHRDEAVSEARDQGQEKGGQDLVIGTAGADDLAQDHPVDAAVMVVGNRDEAALRRDAVQLLLRNLEGHTHLFQDIGGKRRAFRVTELGVDPVHFVEFQ